jgi:DNA-binding MarR family transcriptional regulator
MRDSAILLTEYFDEMLRGTPRLSAASDLFVPENGPKGLAMTVLTAVVRAERPPTVPQIGRSLGYPRQTIQRHVDTLIDDGLVEAIDNPDHKRAKRLEPTSAGRALYKQSHRASLAWAKEFTADLDAEDMATTLRTMRAIRAKLEAIARGRKAA